MTESGDFIVLGTGGVFTSQVLMSLIDLDCRPRAYVQASNGGARLPRFFQNVEIQVEGQDNRLESWLDQQAIRYEVEPGGNLATLVRSLQPAFLLTACWPRLIPREVIQTVSLAALNLHPSLLPHYRGLDPVGDQLAAGDFRFGVTLHLLDDQYDHGDIVRQATLPELEDRSAQSILTEAAKAGAALFMEARSAYDSSGWQPIPQESI